MSLNFILHGECNVGKTSLRNRWVDGIFTGDVAPTFGVDFNIKTLDLVQEMGEEKEEGAVAGASDARDETRSQDDGKGDHSTKPAPCADVQVKINVYDTSGKPGYREVNSTYLLAFDAVLFVYDISSMSTLDELRRYFNDPEHRDKLAAKRKAGMAMLLVGNKCDLPLSQRQVGSQTGQDAAAEFGIPFVEVSAKTGANVREAFMFVTTRAVGEHLARDRLKQSTVRSRRRSVKTTMHPDLQRALRARASVLNLFKGVVGRSTYARRGELAGPPTKRVAGSDRGPGGKRTGGSERRQHFQLPQRSGGEARGGSKRTGGRSAAAPAAWNPTTSSHKLPSGLDFPSPGGAATAANSPVAQSGTGDQPTSYLLERPEAPPAGSMSERKLATLSSGSRPPQLDTGSGILEEDQISSAAAVDTTRARRSPGDSLAPTPTPTPTSLLSLRPTSPRSPGAAPAPREFDPGLTRGPGGSRGGSPERAAGGVGAMATAGDTATRQLKEASRFWLDKWGIKAAKTDATRGRHARVILGSPPSSPPGGGAGAGAGGTSEAIGKKTIQL